MISESTRRKVHAICYLLAAVVLAIMYVVKQNSLAIFGAVICAVLAVKYYRDYQYFKRREEEMDEE